MVVSICVFVLLVSPTTKVRLSSLPFSSIRFSSNIVERWMSDPRAEELEHQIQLAVDKQKRPDTSVSGGDDDSEAFPTSDDHPWASYSASASDQGTDLAERSTNRFGTFHLDDENDADDNEGATALAPRQRRSNANQTPMVDDDSN